MMLMNQLESEREMLAKMERLEQRETLANIQKLEQREMLVKLEKLERTVAALATQACYSIHASTRPRSRMSATAHTYNWAHARSRAAHVCP